MFLTLAGSCITVADCAEDAVKEMNEMLGNYYCFDGYSTFKKACNSKNKVACEFYSELDSTSIEEIKKLCSENTGTACIIAICSIFVHSFLFLPDHKFLL